MKVIAFGLAAGIGVQGWRQWPADGPVNLQAGVLVSVVAIICAYLAGLWRGRPAERAQATAVAIAEARAEANVRQDVNIAVIVPGQGAGEAAPGRLTGVQVPSGAAPWIGERRHVLDLSEVQDGLPLEELLEDGAEA